MEKNHTNIDAKSYIFQRKNRTIKKNTDTKTRRESHTKNANDTSVGKHQNNRYITVPLYAVCMQSSRYEKSSWKCSFSSSNHPYGPKWKTNRCFVCVSCQLIWWRFELNVKKHNDMKNVNQVAHTHNTHAADRTSAMHTLVSRTRWSGRRRMTDRERTHTRTDTCTASMHTLTFVHLTRALFLLLRFEFSLWLKHFTRRNAIGATEPAIMSGQRLVRPKHNHNITSCYCCFPPRIFFRLFVCEYSLWKWGENHCT